MNHDEALAFAGEAIEAIRAYDDDRARETFNAEYPALRSELLPGKPLHSMAHFFYELDEFLNDPEARRMSGLTFGLILSSYEELRTAMMEGKSPS